MHPGARPIPGKVSPWSLTSSIERGDVGTIPSLLPDLYRHYHRLIILVSVVSSTEELAFAAIQLLWVGVIEDALVTNLASGSLLGEEPDTRGTKLFTAGVIRMILG